MSTQKNDLKGVLAQLESKLEYYLVTKAPFALPDNIKEFIVKYGPWIMVVLLVMAIPGILFILGIGAVLTPFAALAAPQASVQMMVGGVVSIASLILEAASIPGLLKRKMSGWRLAYYSSLVGSVYSLITFNVFGLLIGSLISFYILFQVKSKYS
jgi:hypothetical protein